MGPERIGIITDIPKDLRDIRIFKNGSECLALLFGA